MTSTIELRNIYYHICIPTRTLLMISIFMTPNKYMNYWLYLSCLTLIIVLYRYISYDETQKGAFGQPVHWQNMRLTHMAIIIIFILAIMNNRYDIAKIMPIIDIAISLIYMNDKNIYKK
jgi:hypothetical protein